MVSVDASAPVRILLVTYFFPPDLSAGSFRAEALAQALVNSGRNVRLDVITTEPNRYHSHRPTVDDCSNASYTVRRIALPQTRPGLLGQVRCFAEFARQALKAVSDEKYDVVVATSSRLMTAFLGAHISRKVGGALYLDIRDIFVETIQDVFPGKLFRPLNWAFSKAERWALGEADRVNLVSHGFLPYFQERYKRQDYRFFTNGVDEVFVELARHSANELPHTGQRSALNVVYAGNIGDGQGLDEILPDLALRLREVATFTVIGDGGKREKLLERCRQLGAPVSFRDAVARGELIELYQSADVLFLHLNDLPAFTRVLPSKLFEYAALGKPILAGVRGYARTFIEENLDGVGVFDPCDVDGAEKAFHSLPMRVFQRDTFVSKFSRTGIMQHMADDVVDLVQVKRGR